MSRLTSAAMLTAALFLPGDTSPDGEGLDQLPVEVELTPPQADDANPPVYLPATGSVVASNAAVGSTVDVSSDGALPDSSVDAGEPDSLSSGGDSPDDKTLEIRHASKRLCIAFSRSLCRRNIARSLSDIESCVDAGEGSLEECESDLLPGAVLDSYRACLAAAANADDFCVDTLSTVLEGRSILKDDVIARPLDAILSHDAEVSASGGVSAWLLQFHTTDEIFFALLARIEMAVLAVNGADKYGYDDEQVYLIMSNTHNLCKVGLNQLHVMLSGIAQANAMGVGSAKEVTRVSHMGMALQYYCSLFKPGGSQSE